MCRDIHEIEQLNFPVFAKGKCAKSGNKTKIGKIKIAIQCSGILINPYDILFADPDGILVMNKHEAINAILKAEEIKIKEEIIIQKIHQGAEFKQICNIDEHVLNISEGLSSQLKFI